MAMSEGVFIEIVVLHGSADAIHVPHSPYDDILLYHGNKMRWMLRDGIELNS